MMEFNGTEQSIIQKEITSDRGNVVSVSSDYHALYVHDLAG